MIEPIDADALWQNHSELYTRLEHSSLSRVLHPEIARIVNDSANCSVLDYGCGDGRLIDYLRCDLDVDVFDTSAQMLALVKQNAGSRIRQAWLSDEDIPRDQYDVVVLSMVLVCLPTKKAVLATLSNCRRVLRPGGSLVVAVTHPCFRPYTFSDFRTSYGHTQDFQYFAEGSPFKVVITDATGAGLEFTDFHWSLGSLVNDLVASGFRISLIIETPDNIAEGRSNDAVAPFLILRCAK